MEHHELATLPLDQQAKLIENREVTPVELVQLYLDRIEQYDDRLRAYLHVAGDRAMTRAASTEVEITRGEYLGPLHGIPYGVKDQLDVRGLPTTLGFPPLADNIADRDATVISRLDRAGAILIGKHNLDQFGKGGSVDWPFGRPRNPWNLDHSPAGSSAGSGAAVAAGLCSFALGEDTGGSVRNPASANGVSGIRPTFGLVSRHGGVMHSWTNDTIGPIARTADGVSKVLQTIAGHDPKDPLSCRDGVPDYGSTSCDVSRLRVGVITNLAHGDHVHDEVRAAFDAAVGALEPEVGSVEEVELSYTEYAVALQMLTADADVGGAMMDTWLRSHYQDIDRGVRTRLVSGALVPAAVYSTAMRGRALVRQAVLALLAEVDVLLCPTTPSPAGRIDAVPRAVESEEEVNVSHLRRRANAYPFSVANVPAMSVPMGFTSDGLPVGLQIVANPLEEPTVFDVARRYQSVTSWHERSPAMEWEV